MFAPARTPPHIVQRLNEEAIKAIQSPELRERYTGLVMDEMTMSLDQFNRFLGQEFRMNAELVKAAGIQPGN